MAVLAGAFLVLIAIKASIRYRGESNELARRLRFPIVRNRKP
jgi:hypothetical protein